MNRELSVDDQVSVNMGGAASPTPAPGGIAGSGVTVPVEVLAHGTVSLAHYPVRPGQLSQATTSTDVKRPLGIVKHRFGQLYSSKLHVVTVNRELSIDEQTFVNMGGAAPPTFAPGDITGTGVAAATSTVATKLLGSTKKRLGQHYNLKLHVVPVKWELSVNDQIVVFMGGTAPSAPALGSIVGTGVTVLVEVPVHDLQSIENGTGIIAVKSSIATIAVMFTVALLHDCFRIKSVRNSLAEIKSERDTANTVTEVVLEYDMQLKKAAAPLKTKMVDVPKTMAPLAESTPADGTPLCVDNGGVCGGAGLGSLA